MSTGEPGEGELGGPQQPEGTSGAPLDQTILELTQVVHDLDDENLDPETRKTLMTKLGEKVAALSLWVGVAGVGSGFTAIFESVTVYLAERQGSEGGDDPASKLGFDLSSVDVSALEAQSMQLFAVGGTGIATAGVLILLATVLKVAGKRE